MLEQKIIPHNAKLICKAADTDWDSPHSWLATAVAVRLIYSAVKLQFPIGRRLFNKQECYAAKQRDVVVDRDGDDCGAGH